MAEQAQHWALGLAAQPRDEVRARLGAADQVDLEAGVAKHPREVLLGVALVAGRVDRVEAHQALEEVGRLLLELGGHPVRLRQRLHHGGDAGHEQHAGDGPHELDL